VVLRSKIFRFPGVLDPRARGPEDPEDPTR
jgi:hypothetical protein